MSKSREEIERFADERREKVVIAKSIIMDFLSRNKGNFYSSDELIKMVSDHENWLENGDLSGSVTVALAEMAIKGEIEDEYVGGESYYASKFE